MMSESKYVIEHGSSPGELEKRVNKKLKKGYILSGHMVVGSTQGYLVYLQPLTYSPSLLSSYKNRDVRWNNLITAKKETNEN